MAKKIKNPSESTAPKDPDLQDTQEIEVDLSWLEDLPEVSELPGTRAGFRLPEAQDKADDTIVAASNETSGEIEATIFKLEPDGSITPRTGKGAKEFQIERPNFEEDTLPTFRVNQESRPQNEQNEIESQYLEDQCDFISTSLIFDLANKVQVGQFIERRFIPENNSERIIISSESQGINLHITYTNGQKITATIQKQMPTPNTVSGFEVTIRNTESKQVIVRADHDINPETVKAKDLNLQITTTIIGQQNRFALVPRAELTLPNPTEYQSLYITTF